VLLVYPSKINEGELGSVKIIGMIGIIIPTPIMSIRSVINKIGNGFLFSIDDRGYS
jgi:hypothetical protein